MPRDLRAYLLDDVRAYLRDVVDECGDIKTYTAETTFDEYLAHKRRRRAVERSFTIAEEALVRANRDIAEHLRMLVLSLAFEMFWCITTRTSNEAQV